VAFVVVLTLLVHASFSASSLFAEQGLVLTAVLQTILNMFLFVEGVW
jgi:hypothetical protein